MMQVPQSPANLKKASKKSLNDIKIIVDLWSESVPLFILNKMCVSLS